MYTTEMITIHQINFKGYIFEVFIDFSILGILTTKNLTHFPKVEMLLLNICLYQNQMFSELIVTLNLL